MQRILDLVDEIINQYLEDYALVHPDNGEQILKRSDLNDKYLEIQSALECFKEEIKATEQNACEEERVSLIEEYESDMAFLIDENKDLRATMRHFLEHIDIDLDILRKEAYND